MVKSFKVFEINKNEWPIVSLDRDDKVVVYVLKVKGWIALGGILSRGYVLRSENLPV